VGIIKSNVINFFISLDNPKDIYKLLEEQTKVIEYEIDNLNRVLKAIFYFPKER
jgi:CRISPR/Cas system type I-B associated protein Csh2 (Cas7 group RAMP superfamily)